MTAVALRLHTAVLGKPQLADETTIRGPLSDASKVERGSISLPSTSGIGPQHHTAGADRGFPASSKRHSAPPAPFG